MITQQELPVILKTEEFKGLDNNKSVYSIGYGNTAIENLNLDTLKQIKLTLDQFLEKESD